MFFFDYNPASQIPERSTVNPERPYSYVPTQPSTDSYTVDRLNKLLTAGENTLSHDARGNMTDDGPNTYTYDFDNRLLTADTPGDDAAMKYDPLGRLYEIAITGGAGLARQARRKDAPHRTLIALGVWLLRKLQWETEGRMPEPRDLLQFDGGAGAHRTMAMVLQH